MARETRRVTVDLSFLVDRDLEGLLDWFNENGWPGAGTIQNIDYKAVEVESGGYAIAFEVTADVVHECQHCGYEMSAAPATGLCGSCAAEGR